MFLEYQINEINLRKIITQGIITNVFFLFDNIIIRFYEIKSVNYIFYDI